MVGGYRVAAMGTAVVDDIIYVFGGWETSASPYFSSETWAFDPNQPSGSRWTNLGAPLQRAPQLYHERRPGWQGICHRRRGEL